MYCELYMSNLTCILYCTVGALIAIVLSGISRPANSQLSYQSYGNEVIFKVDLYSGLKCINVVS